MEFSPIPSPNLSLIKDKCNESDTQICLASSNKTYCLFDLVPPEIIREILIFLPIDDFIKSKRVCKLWNEITKDSVSFFQNILNLNLFKNLFSVVMKMFVCFGGIIAIQQCLF